MSGVSNYKDVSHLHRAYQELGQEEVDVQDVIAKLPAHLREKVFSSRAKYSSELLTAAQAQLSIRDITYEIYDSGTTDTKAKIHGVFYRCCGVSRTGDPNWGGNHIRDENRAGNFLRSLEIVSEEREVKAWAGNDPNRQQAAERIMYFINNQTETNLDLSRLDLSSLPDVFDNTEMRSRLTNLDLTCNKLQSLPDSIGNLTRLIDLYLDDNQLQSLPESIGNLSCLRCFSLSGLTNLHSLPNSILQLSSRCDIGLQRTSLSSQVLG